jgi:hypothetical protein
MSDQSDLNASEGKLLRADLIRAFPDTAFAGPVTDADGLRDEDLDEPQALYDALHGRKWSEVERSVLVNFPDGFLLLTDPAFVAFLPAWLSAAIDNQKVRHSVIYSFSPDVHKASKKWNPGIRKLRSVQTTAFLRFLQYCLKVESSESIRKEIRSAIAFAKTFSKEAAD